MRNRHDILLAIDDSEASRMAVLYVAAVARGAPHFRIRLLHVLPHIPTHLLEHGGAEDPDDERRLSRELDEGTARWRRRCEAAATSLLDEVRDTLESGGVAGERITIEFAAPLPEESIGIHILRAAAEGPCDTVVVGRSPRSWLAGKLHRSPSKALLRGRAPGVAIWIVT
mgnify:CR=1 FL=1